MSHRRHCSESRARCPRGPERTAPARQRARQHGAAPRARTVQRLPDAFHLGGHMLQRVGGCARHQRGRALSRRDRARGRGRGCSAVAVGAQSDASRCAPRPVRLRATARLRRRRLLLLLQADRRADAAPPRRGGGQRHGQ